MQTRSSQGFWCLKAQVLYPMTALRLPWLPKSTQVLTFFSLFSCCQTEDDLLAEMPLTNQAHSDKGDMRGKARGWWGSLKLLRWTSRIVGGRRRRRDGSREADGHDGGADERRRYQSWAALLISSRPRCLVTLNDTLVGPMVSLRWQHDRPPLLKCKSGFNLKQSRLAEIIFLPPSQVLLSLLSISSPSSLQLLLLPTFPPFLPPHKKISPSRLFFHQLDPWGTGDGKSIFRRSDR